MNEYPVKIPYTGFFSVHLVTDSSTTNVTQISSVLSKDILQLLLPHLLSQGQPQKRFPASSLHARYLINIPLSETEEVKTDHSRIAFPKFIGPQNSFL